MIRELIADILGLICIVIICIGLPFIVWGFMP